MDANATVNQLISASGGWNTHVIRDNFTLEDSNLILKLPIVVGDRDDNLLWHYNENGQYSVKSGYWLGHSLDNSMGPSNTTPRSSWWNTFWSVKIPLKVKLFIWKAGQDWIPTKINIGRRGIQTNGVCEACKCSAEDTLHTLWYCSKLKCIRDEWSSKNMILRGNHNNFLDLIGDCFSAGNVKNADLFCIVVWRIWFCRNSTFHEAKKHKMSDVISRSLSFLQDFQTPILQKAEVCVNSYYSRWRPPENDTYKANCDVVLDHGTGKIGIGVIIRNSEGNVLASCSLVVESSLSLKVAKLMAIHRGLQFGIDCGLNPGNIEIDDANVVNCINNGGHLDSDFGLLISDILGLKEGIGGVTFSHTHKIANKVANNLARYAFTINEDTYWMEDFPLSLKLLVEADMPN